MCCARVGPLLGARPAELLPRAQRSLEDWGAHRDPVHARRASPRPGPTMPSPAGRATPTAGRRSSSSAQGSAWRRERGARFCMAAELQGDCISLTVRDPGWHLRQRPGLSSLRPQFPTCARPLARLPCSFKLVMSCSCFSSSELFILAGGAGDKRQGGRGEGDTGEGVQKARCRWRGVWLHYPEVGIAPAPPPPGAQHAVRSSRAPTRGPRLLHLRQAGERAGLGAEPGMGVGRERRVNCLGPGAPAILPGGYVQSCVWPLRPASHPDTCPKETRPTPDAQAPAPALTHWSLEPRLENLLFCTKRLDACSPPSRCM